MDQVVMNIYGLQLKENPRDRNEVLIDRLLTDYDKRFVIDFVKLKYCEFEGKANFPMLSLIVMANNEETHVQRYDANALYQWREMLQETDKIEKTHKQGFYCHHGLGDPLKEFEEADLRDITYLSQRTPTIWFFLGNHEKRSGVFHYYIWKPEIVEAIKEKLPKEKIYPL